MGVIYELLRLPEREKKKFLDDIMEQEAAEKLRPQKNNGLQNKSGK